MKYIVELIKTTYKKGDSFFNPLGKAWITDDTTSQLKSFESKDLLIDFLDGYKNNKYFISSKNEFLLDNSVNIHIEMSFSNLPVTITGKAIPIKNNAPEPFLITDSNVVDFIMETAAVMPIKSDELTLFLNCSFRRKSDTPFNTLEVVPLSSMGDEFKDHLYKMIKQSIL